MELSIITKKGTGKQISIDMIVTIQFIYDIFTLLGFIIESIIDYLGGGNTVPSL